MQFPSHLEIEEDINQLNPVELTVKSTGEFVFKGSPDPRLIDKLIVASDYHQDQNRRFKSELEQRKSELEQRISDEAKMTNAMTITFLGLATLTLILCAFLSINKSSNQEHKQCLTTFSQDSHQQAKAN